jgi:hypothetical protein
MINHYMISSIPSSYMTILERLVNVIIRYAPSDLTAIHPLPRYGYPFGYQRRKAYKNLYKGIRDI